jgi:hypothetical protein
MISFLVLYRGESVATAELLAVSNDDELIAHVASTLLKQNSEKSPDRAVAALRSGRQRALRLVLREAKPGVAGPE